MCWIRYRWGRSSSSRARRSSSVPSSPVSAYVTCRAMWKSPKLTASGSPCARCRTSAAVHSPTPGRLRSAASTSRRRQRQGPLQRGGPLARPVRRRRTAHRRCGSAATPTMGSGPVRRGRQHPHPTLGAGTRCRVAPAPDERTPARPGLASGDLLLERGAASASSTRPLRLTRQCGSRAQQRVTCRFSGSKSLTSRPRRASGARARTTTRHPAPRPRTGRAVLTGVRRRTIWPVTGPSGVRQVRQIAPSAARSNVGSPPPRRCTRVTA